MGLSAEKEHPLRQDGSVRPAPAALLKMAAVLQATLRAHRHGGIAAYPTTPGLQRFLAGEGPLADHPGARPLAPQAATDGGVQGQQGPAVLHRVKRDHLAALQGDIAACQECRLAEARLGQTPGMGEATSGLMIVGDYCRQEGTFAARVLFGEEEDVMLGNMVRAMGYEFEAVRITNAIKCCPQPNCQPGADCARSCLAHLRREIALVRPRILCAMGEVAAGALLGIRESLVRLRGRFHDCAEGGVTPADVQVAVTFHPRFLLAQPELSRLPLKRAAWQDLQMIQRRLRQVAGGKG